MPTYTYTGKTTYVNSTYGIRANEGDSIQLTYFLPADMDDNFTLTNANVPAAIVPKSNEYTLATGVPQTIVTKGYTNVLVKLIDVGTNVVTIKFWHATQNEYITLNANHTSFETGLGYMLNSEKIIVEATTGAPKILVILSFSSIS